jgi:hypothetical protein
MKTINRQLSDPAIDLQDKLSTKESKGVIEAIYSYGIIPNSGYTLQKEGTKRSENGINILVVDSLGNGLPPTINHLAEKGFEGSLLIHTYNFGSGAEFLGTGQIHYALLNRKDDEHHILDEGIKRHKELTGKDLLFENIGIFGLKASEKSDVYKNLKKSE